MITKAAVLKHFHSVEAAAAYFDISVQAIYQWPDDEPIPEPRALQLMLDFPRKFPRGKRVTGREVRAP
jgi:hypothetical protein